MTIDNINLTSDDLELKKSYEEKLNQALYVLTRSQYDEINRIAALYDSLYVLLQPFDADENVGHIIALLDHVNSSFFCQLESLTPLNK